MPSLFESLCTSSRVHDTSCLFSIKAFGWEYT
nr:MAG TPA: hypothetical protein [Caudoviricetes sp.]